jgi:nitrogen fixation NifU-like protein
MAADQGGGPRGGSAEHGHQGGRPPSDQDEQFYREYILDHYKNPRNFGRLEAPTISHEEDNPLCGDVIGMDLAVKDGRIEDVRFHGRGCAISQAAASLLTERIKGLTVEEARRIGKEDVFEELGIDISPARIKCALLSLKVLKVGAWGLGDWSAEEE